MEEGAHKGLGATDIVMQPWAPCRVERGEQRVGTIVTKSRENPEQGERGREPGNLGKQASILLQKSNRRGSPGKLEKLP